MSDNRETGTHSRTIQMWKRPAHPRFEPSKCGRLPLAAALLSLLVIAPAPCAEEDSDSEA